MIYLLTGWSIKDGNVVVYPFSTAEKRDTFLADMEKYAETDNQFEYFWNHNWYKTEKALDSVEVQRKIVYDTY